MIWWYHIGEVESPKISLFSSTSPQSLHIKMVAVCTHEACRSFWTFVQPDSARGIDGTNACGNAIRAGTRMNNEPRLCGLRYQRTCPMWEGAIPVPSLDVPVNQFDNPECESTSAVDHADWPTDHAAVCCWMCRLDDWMTTRREWWSYHVNFNLVRGGTGIWIASGASLTSFWQRYSRRFQRRQLGSEDELRRQSEGARVSKNGEAKINNPRCLNRQTTTMIHELLK